MKIIKRPASTILKEEAHGGSGARKVWASPEHLKSTHFEMMTYGYLPAGKTFDWHDHTDIEEVMAWKSGWFQFNAYDIKMVMRQISRWYDVEVVYEGKIPTGHFTGLVSRDNDIEQVLKIMQSGGVRFKIEGRKVIVLS